MPYCLNQICPKLINLSKATSTNGFAPPRGNFVDHVFLKAYYLTSFFNMTCLLSGVWVL